MPKITFLNPPISNGDIGVIGDYFSACVSLLFQHSPTHPNINCDIRIKFGKKGPHTQYGGNAVHGYDVDLTAENNCWDQHLYQFSHEACHILAQCQKCQSENQWFEESLCEVASLFSLKTIANMGTRGPCGNYLVRPNILYSQHLNNYVDKLINDPARQFAGAKMDQWFSLNETALRLDPYCRCLQWIISNKLFPMFLSSPSNFAAIEFLNNAPYSSGKNSFSQYLDNWKNASPEQHHLLIDEVKKLFF